MSEHMNTIWMNVTTSAKWHRPPVGIVRVERFLSYELSKIHGTRFKQCIWQDGKFVEWLPRSLATASDLPITQDAEPNQAITKLALPAIFPILPRKQALIVLAQGLLSLMPGRIQPYFNRILYYIRPVIVPLLASERTRQLLTMLRGRTANPILADPGAINRSSSSPDQSALFSSGDVLISVGLDWDHPYYKHFYALRKHSGVKVVTCCYDLIPVIYPQYCVGNVANLFKSYFLEIADGSDLILCISKQSEADLNDMLHRTGGARPPTRVIPMGDNVPASGNAVITPAVKAICEEPFILYVSTIERRKNHEVLYRAYHRLCSQGKRANLPKLIFVGMQGWGVNELIKDIELDPLTHGLIVQLNHVSDTELRRLYDAAMFCVFPSLYEGWGLPVGEALSLGKAIICSNRGSLPEVGGDLVHYIDSWNPQAWADEIYRMSTDECWRTHWIDKVKAGYMRRSWDEVGAIVSESVESCMLNSQQNIT